MILLLKMGYIIGIEKTIEITISYLKGNSCINKVTD